ncbi:hypothetical protein [Agaribacter marinus]|uniref:Adhesin domain-containing protein n=1 Tax=Agaribacter marinus TaxID=1431249 RepID=A0AA37SVJ2_9ALTE|nr:hypothetical protein [Agaribacter marinus]GLR69479.1 hypothetical protein GCM10007852_03870 [Agaribacter marinus]
MKTNAYFNALCCSLVILSFAANAETIQEKELTLPTKGIKAFKIDASAGFLHVKGKAGISEILVEATLISDEFEDTDFTLNLEEKGNKAFLITKVGKRAPNYNAKIDLTVTVPNNLVLDIVDGSGEIKVDDFTNNVRVDDGSGSMQLTNIRGELNVEDGSGKIIIQNIGGDLRLDDGSGSVEITDVKGDVRVEDGSGSITLRGIDGHVIVDDGSGSINVDGAKSFTLIDDGSGSVNLSNVKERS